MNYADKLLEFFGPNGERWFQGMYFSHYNEAQPAEDTKACLLGAMSIIESSSPLELLVPIPGKTATGRGSYAEFRTVLQQILREQFGRGGIIGFNDDPSTTWEDVRMVLEKTSVRLDERI